ncbi:early endosome antigen 1 isoform X2 [Drosophila santomea]|nr:early endosome antigen 1 isoform X2 [Drosophila santomea]XP_039486586.1 early endosome antigen 1 isoform X2 [Drosophila santomea]
MLALEKKLRETELELAIATEKLSLYDDKIKDKNEIIEAVKLSNNLYKSNYKERFDSQASIIKKLEEELSALRQEKIKPSQELETNTNSSLVAKLKSKIFFLKEGVKKKEVVIASLEAQIKENAKKDKDNLELINSKTNSKEKEHRAQIASLKNQIGQRNESLEKNKGVISSLKAQITEKDQIHSENIKLITNLQGEIKEKDDQRTLLELDLNLEKCKTREKDNQLNNQAATILKLKTCQEKLKENQRRIPSESECDQHIENFLNKLV